MLDGTVGSQDLLARLARQHTARCIARLAEVLDGDDPGAAVAAAHELLSRGYDMPVQPLSIDAGGIHVVLNTDAEPERPHHTNGESVGNRNAA